MTTALIVVAVVSFLMGWAFGPVIADYIRPRFKPGELADRLAALAEANRQGEQR